MRIQHNIMAMNAYRNLGMNNSQLSKNLEKLSSGYRINRAGDDAAGLAISEKMRAQISGLDQAQKNAQSGINLVQTAEGALTEVHDMLNRMVTLATQAANGTYSESDRAKIQAEIDSLTEEIDRIADNSNFNGTKLLDGSLSSEGVVANGTTDADAPKAMTANGDVDATITAATKTKWTSTAAFGTATAAGNMEVTFKDANGSTQKITLEIATGDTAAKAAAKINGDDTLGKLFEASVNGDGKLVIESQAAGEDGASITSITAPAGFAPAGASVAGKDALVTLEKFGTGNAITAGGTAIKGGTTLTIGDKTYEILSDVNKVKEGNVAVALGTTDGVTLENLVNALKQNGVDSAKLVKAAGADADSTDCTGIAITDLSEIQAAQTGNVNASSNTEGVTVENTVDKAGKYTLATTGLTAGTASTVTLEYLDDNGEKQSMDLVVDAPTGGDVTTELIKAMKDAGLDDLFDIKADSAGTSVELTAKTAGTDGAKMLSIKVDTNAVTAATVNTEAKDGGIQFNVDTSVLEEGDTLEIDGKTYEFVKHPSNVTEGNIAVVIDSNATAATANKNTAKNLATAMKSNGVDAIYTADGKVAVKSDVESANKVAGGMTLQIGSEAVETINVAIDSVKAEDLGIKGLKIGKPEEANEAIGKVKDAIEKVSVTRGNLGAIQNRLEHTINNLGVMEENIQDAEANIRDTDIADEMMAYTKNNILIQSAQAMLAQANQTPQGVLQLMQ